VFEAELYVPQDVERILLGMGHSPSMTRSQASELFPNHKFHAVPRTSSTFAGRVFRAVTIANGCWLWTSTLDGDGYGVLGRGARSAGNIAAHRASWELLIGPIPNDLQYDHLCRVRACVNPGHGEPVPQKVNISRGIGPSAIYAKRTECPNGHPLDGVLGARGGSRAHRYCKTCARQKSRAYHVSKVSYSS